MESAIDAHKAEPILLTSVEPALHEPQGTPLGPGSVPDVAKADVPDAATAAEDDFSCKNEEEQEKTNGNDAAATPAGVPGSIQAEPRPSEQESVETKTAAANQREEPTMQNDSVQRSANKTEAGEQLKHEEVTGTETRAAKPEVKLHTVQSLLTSTLETVAKYSDDEVSLSESLEAASEPENDSDYNESDLSETVQRPRSVRKPRRLGDDDEEEAGPIISKHEVVDEEAPTLPPDYTVSPDAAVEFVGTVVGAVEKSVIVKASVSGEFRVLKDNSVLCFENRDVLGVIFETFGRLLEPNYRVKFNTDEDFDKVKGRVGERVYYVVSDSQFLYTDTIKKAKGTDASNCHDEELPELEQEYLDDDAEMAARQRRKKAKLRRDDLTPQPAQVHAPAPYLTPRPTSSAQNSGPATPSTTPSVYNQPYAYPQPQSQPQPHPQPQPQVQPAQQAQPPQHMGQPYYYHGYPNVMYQYQYQQQHPPVPQGQPMYGYNQMYQGYPVGYQMQMPVPHYQQVPQMRMHPMMMQGMPYRGPNPVQPGQGGPPPAHNAPGLPSLPNVPSMPAQAMPQNAPGAPHASPQPGSQAQHQNLDKLALLQLQLMVANQLNGQDKQQ